MRVDHTAFAGVTNGGETYKHDVIIRLSGEVVKQGRSSPESYRTPRTSVSDDEAKSLFEKKLRQL